MPIKREGECIVDVMIEGVDPVQFNRFADEAKAGIRKGSTKVAKGEKDPRETEARHRGYFDKDGKPYLPLRMVWESLIAAGTLIKDGRSKLTTTKTSVIPGVLRIIGQVAPLQMRTNGKGKYGSADWYPGEYSPQLADGSRVIVYRPTFDEWLVRFQVAVDTEFISVGLTRQLFDYAGKFKGIGTQRRGRKGTFGGFVISEWQPEGAKE
jgi:hypothetical protein